jgi:hypothetical protein
MYKPMLLIVKTLLIISCLCCLPECKKENSSEPLSYSNIAGTYKAEYSYHFECPSYSCDISGNSQPVVITQNGSTLYIGSCSGTIDMNNTVKMKGCLISKGGTQDFLGTYNPTLKKISGTFSGTTCESGPYGTGSYEGIVSNGLFNLTLLDSSSNPEPPEPNPSESQLFFNCTQGNFFVEGNWQSGTTSSGIRWLDDSTIIAFDYTSPANASVAQIGFSNKPAVGVYNFTFSNQKYAYLFWALNVNLADTAEVNSESCTLTSGTLNLISGSGKNFTGNFSGDGNYMRNHARTTRVQNGMINLVGFNKNNRNYEIPKEIKKLLMLLNKSK